MLRVNFACPKTFLSPITGWQDDDRLRKEIEFASEPEPTHDHPEDSEEVLLLRELIESGRSEEEAKELIESATREALREQRRLLRSESQTTPMDGDDDFSEKPSGPLVEGAVRGGMGSSQRPVTVQVPPRPPSSGGGTSRNLGAETTGRPLPEPPVRVELAEIDDNSERAESRTAAGSRAGSHRQDSRSGTCARTHTRKQPWLRPL